MARFPSTMRTGFTKASGAAPGAAISLHPEESVFTHAAKETVAPTQMVNTLAPAVTGTTTVGSTLTSTQGTWTGANGAFDPEWQQSPPGGGNWNRIMSGNGALTFLLTAAQLGSVIRCRVRATNGAGPRFANSNTTATIT